VAVLVALVLLAVSAALAYAVRRYVRERDAGRRMRALFSRYVPAQVVKDLMERSDPRELTAQTCYATVLRCRIRNFALFSEELTAEETLHALNEFHALAGAAIERQRGVIESLRGDSITAVFGVLIEAPFQEERALRAALTIVRLASALNERWQRHGLKPFAVSVGVHSGEIVAGDIGYQRRREFAIVGNPVQVATSLESVAEELNASIVASGETFDAVAELFVGIPAPSLPLRGLKRVQRAFVIRGLSRSEEEVLLLRERRLDHTTVKREAPAPGATSGEYVAPQEEPVAPVEPFAAAPVPEPFNLFRLDNALPAMPEAPPIAGLYEDGHGPPMRLAP
jgi:class 3 adenylate cyclase